MDEENILGGLMDSLNAPKQVKMPVRNSADEDIGALIEDRIVGLLFEPILSEPQVTLLQTLMNMREQNERIKRHS